MVPQYRILLQGLRYELFGGDPDDFPTEMENRREEALSQPLLGEESLIVRHSSSYQSLGSDNSPVHITTDFPLFPPGRILHIKEDGPSRRSAAKPLTSLHRFIFFKCLNVQPLLEVSKIIPEYCSATVSGSKCMILISSKVKLLRVFSAEAFSVEIQILFL